MGHRIAACARPNCVMQHPELHRRADHPAAALNAQPTAFRAGRKGRKRGAARQQRTVLVQAVVAAPEKPVGTSLPPFEAWSTGAPVKKRTDLKTIMLLGAGPIVIGQVSLPDPGDALVDALTPASSSDGA